MKIVPADELKEGDLFFSDREAGECIVHVSKDLFYIGFQIIVLGGGDQFRIQNICPEAFKRVSIFARNVVTNEPALFVESRNHGFVVEQ